MQKNSTAAAMYKTVLSDGDKLACSERGLLLNFRLMEPEDQAFISRLALSLANEPSTSGPH